VKGDCEGKGREGMRWDERAAGMEGAAVGGARNAATVGKETRRVILRQ
jgi:hypothetical protein